MFNISYFICLSVQEDDLLRTGFWYFTTRCPIQLCLHFYFLKGPNVKLW